MTDTGRSYPKAFRWARTARYREAESTVLPPIAVPYVRQRLLLSDVHCAFDGPADSIAAMVTAHLVLTNDADHEIEYRVESIKVVIQNRVAEMTDPSPVTLVVPGETSVIRCPPIRAVDRTGPSSGNIDYVLVYGHPDATEAQRFRRQQGLWFRFEASPDGAVLARFVERYDEDDPAT